MIDKILWGEFAVYFSVTTTIVGSFIMELYKSSSFVRGRLITLFFIGVLLLVLFVQQLITIWTPKNSLVALKGTLQSCDTYVTSVNSANHYGYEAKSQKADLIFYLQEHKKKFALSENIGSNYNDEHYEKIKNKLKRADTVTVWVKKSALGNWQPQVFEIDTDKETVLDFQTVRFEERPLTAFLLLTGLSCVIFPIYFFYPRLFGKQQVEKAKRHTTSVL